MTDSLDAADFRRRFDLARTGRIDETALPCSPWDRWVLVALHRHAKRQRFVEQVVRERLSAAPEALAHFGAFEHPEGPGIGEVPGLPKWRYRFHGTGCCLTHEDGTEFDVDFDREHGSASVDPWFFARFLATKPELDWLEGRLGSGWKAAIQPLLVAGLLEGEHRVRVAPQVTDWCDAVDRALDECLEPPDGLHPIAVALADFPLAAELDPHQGNVVPLAARQIEDRCRELEARIAARLGVHVDACLLSLRSLDAERARASVHVEFERGPIDGVLSTGMALLLDDPRPDDAPAVCALLARLHGQQAPVPHLRTCATRHLLAPYRRATVPDHLRTLLLDALAEDQRAGEGEAALIVYLLDAERGLARLSAGLQSQVRYARGQCAAALGLIGTSEALEVLRRAQTSEAVAVLAYLRGDPPEPGPSPRGHTIAWRGKPKQVYRIADLVTTELEFVVFAIADSLWTEYEPWLRRWDAH